MVLKMYKKKLNKVYPAMSWYNWLVLIPIGAVIAIVVAVFSFGELDFASSLITLASGICVVAIAVGMLTVSLMYRRKVRAGVIAIGQGLVIRIEKDDFNRQIEDVIQEYAAYLARRRVVDSLLRTFQPLAVTPSRSSLPPIFITIKPAGKVRVWWRGGWIRAAGLSKNNWCQVEWDGNKARTTALVAHEVSHTILSAAGLYNGEKQHELIRAAGVEKLLF